MKHILLIILTLFTFVSFTQELKGTWQGMMSSSLDFSEAKILYLDFDNDTKYARIEFVDEDIFAVKRTDVKNTKHAITVTETSSKTASRSRKSPRCKLTYTLNYNDSTGYLTGSYSSSDCRGVAGYVVLYPNVYDFPSEKQNNLSKSWFNRFKYDYKRGYSAPQIRLKEMEAFVFKPIYFDHDKSDIRPEFKAYLKQMVYVVNGHHDIRIKVTGHTDAVGTDAYNVGLSERRAKAIKDYFVSIGLPEDKLDIDFKGERAPVDNNNTSAGKQRNRRVDFVFI